MAWPVYSTRFLCKTLSAGQTETYTVPAGRTAVVKAATVVQASTGTSSANLYVTIAGGSSVGVWTARFVTTTVVQTLTWPGEIVLQAGEKISWTCTTLDMQCSASGFLLTNV